MPEGVKLDQGAKAWPGLGRVIEVLELPQTGANEADDVSQGVEGLKV